MMKKGVRNKARRVGIIVLAAVMAWALCACGGQENKTEGDNNVTEKQEEVKAVENSANTDTAADADTTVSTDTAADSDSTGLETDSFAHGISEDSDSKDTEANAADNSVAAPEPLEPGIEEKCPVKAANRKAGVSYPKAQHVNYYSETCGRERGVNILLPADYNTDTQYPVFYVLHGIFGNENSFTSDTGNKINEIVTNMAADGYINAPIIVFPNMYASSDPAQQPGFTAEACEPYDNFVNDLVNDLMPYMAANYSILTDRENTWLAGFSMGGRETLYITLCHPELFGYVCAMSPAPGMTPAADMFMSHPGTLTEDEVRFEADAVLPNVLMICCGTRDSVVGKFPLGYHELYEKNGIDHIWYEINGADHDNNVIKSGIYNLLKAISLDTNL